MPNPAKLIGRNAGILFVVTEAEPWQIEIKLFFPTANGFAGLIIASVHPHAKWTKREIN
jgi:hypothetical protein